MSHTFSGEYRYRRRVQFAETDLAGIVHFSMMFRYMEEAEHALWRAAGLTISARGSDIGWPRLAAECQFRSRLYFEEEFDVLVRIAEVKTRTLVRIHDPARRDRHCRWHHDVSLRQEESGDDESH